MDILIELIIWIVRALAKSSRGESVGDPFDDDLAPAPQVWRPPPRETWMPQVHKLLEHIVERAQTTANAARHERVLNRFVAPLTEHVIPRARQLQQAPLDYYAMDAAVRELRAITSQINTLIQQRKTPKRAARLGDADALARACYTPLVEFAKARRLPLTSHEPVTYYDKTGKMGFVTGFAPVGLAPIELPSSFFARITWWPALAHEIAHDFYISTAGFDQAIRQELGLVDQATGRHPIRIDDDGIDESELWRMLSAWFEELFCDVFGTLMVGPGYVWSMLDHFSSPADPSKIVTTFTNDDGGYDVHPPRHLRLLTALRVLEHARLENVASEARSEWKRLHRGWPTELWVWGNTGWSVDWVRLEADALVEPLMVLVDHLMTSPLKALAGYRLPDVPGVDYGPHAKAETARVANEILAGKPMHHTSARWVISGAMEAWHREPSREKEIMRRVRANVTATASLEHSPDAYDREAIADRTAHVAARQAFLLHELLAPPLALRCRRPGMLR